LSLRCGKPLPTLGWHVKCEGSSTDAGLDGRPDESILANSVRQATRTKSSDCQRLTSMALQGQMNRRVAQDACLESAGVSGSRWDPPGSAWRMELAVPEGCCIASHRGRGSERDEIGHWNWRRTTRAYRLLSLNTWLTWRNAAEAVSKRIIRGERRSSASWS
jgi:hypothetical protein